MAPSPLIAIPVLFALLVPRAAAQAEPAFNYPPTEEGLRQCLQDLVPGEDMEQEVRGLIAALNDSDYATREQAHFELLKRPMVPGRMLDIALEKAPPDQAYRLRVIRARHSDQNAQKVFKTALQIIATRRQKGLAGALLSAFRLHGEEALRYAAEEALVATLLHEDVDTLFEQFRHGEALERDLIIGPLAALHPAEGFDRLLPALEAPEGAVRLKAGIAFANRGRREALPVLIDLLESEAYFFRWQSIEALRAATGQHFGFHPSEVPARRQVAVQEWRTWLQESGRDAPLKFPLKMPEEMALFNGRDLGNWLEFQNGRRVGAREVADYMAQDGLLICAGAARGYLRTREKYRNYELELEWRFPSGSGDGGVCVMMSGPDGPEPKSLEVQTHTKNAGDLYLIGNFNARDKHNQPLRFRGRKFHPSNENPGGQWNHMKLRLHNGLVQIWINGLLQNQATGGNGEPGYIQLRNEGDRTEYRNVRLRVME